MHALCIEVDTRKCFLEKTNSDWKTTDLNTLWALLDEAATIIMQFYHSVVQRAAKCSKLKT